MASYPFTVCVRCFILFIVFCNGLTPNLVSAKQLYKPEVHVRIEPTGPVVEGEEQNVTLHCDVTRGNPPTLTRVKWLLNGELLNQLSDCNQIKERPDSTITDVEDMCEDIVPSKLLLQQAGRDFHGNYTCQGGNSAGWGPLSEPTELLVYYEPGPASLTYSPTRIVKGQTLILSCSVEDYGRPVATRFRWYRDSRLVADVVTAQWTIDPVSLETTANFSCMAVNEAGFGGVATVLIQVLDDQVSSPSSFPSSDFSQHWLIKPKIYHGRERRQISSTRDEDGLHLNSLTIGYVSSDGTEHVLDLQLNRELIPSDFFVRYQQSGKHVVNKPTGKDLELCHYVGVVRDLEGSWAAVSTCRGLRGVVYDGTAMHYIQPTDGNDLESEHFFYKHEDLISNRTCGYQSGHHPENAPQHHEYSHTTPHSTTDGPVKNRKYNKFNRIERYKRSANDEPKIRGPYNANKQSRYVELVLVIDNSLFKELGENLSSVHHYSKDIANIINSLYAPLNIFIALTGVVVWTEYDEISLSTNGDTTLTNFLHYRRERLVKDHPNDNAQLMTREQFLKGVVGRALKGPICTLEYSGGVTMYHSNVVGLVATTVAHMMGHNFGMEHDTEDCQCPDEHCVMSHSINSMTHWSSCSQQSLAQAFARGMDYCLRNKPTRLFDSPVCGNGFVESGEQCDCGLTKNCGNNRCCEPATCRLFPNATCATGGCCDLETCRPSKAGLLCRSADYECDLPEFCTGQSEFCPNDVFKMDAATCDHGNAFCYHGSCRTRTDQCKLLWGPSGKSSDDRCYKMNKRGSRHGNCGYDPLNHHYSACQQKDVFCGALHCTHLNERLEFGLESVSILSHSFINSNGSIISCRTATVDLGLGQVDPGLVPDGAKCGKEKMCVNQTCISVASLRLQAGHEPGAVCPSDCSGHGVCNSLEDHIWAPGEEPEVTPVAAASEKSPTIRCCNSHCHCEKGFAPPLCKLPGPGGSLDSGPASHPSDLHQWEVIVL